ncbi:hypothetical protein Sjap_025973 [Stephania japonica]|uniref:Uncharacterized protein n=1 Tax=Stephania japonica TaxID=461633 RepID=A0AAP0E744_9MAGN
MNRKVKEVEIVLGLNGTMFTIPAKVFAKGSSVRVIKLEAYCYSMHLKVLGLSLGKLKKLEIENTGNNRSSCGKDNMAIPNNRLGVCKLELHTPNLSTFIYKGELFEYFSFGGLVALIDVDVSLSIFFISCPKFSGQLSVFNKWEDTRYKFLKGLNGARNLALGTVQVCSSKVPNTLHDLLTSYTNLRKLELRLSPIDDTSLSWLASLLYCCSSLETLVLHDVKLMILSQEFPNVKISFQIRKSNVVAEFCDQNGWSAETS